MAARTKTPKNDDIDDDLDDVLDDMDEPEPEALSFERVLAELSNDTDGAQVHIFRDVKGKVNGSYLFIVPPAEFDMVTICDKLRDDYGGGEFRAVLKRNGRIVKSAPISVEVPKSRLPGFQPPPVVDKSGDAMTQLIATMQENTRALMESARQEARENQKQMNTLMLEMVKASTMRAHEPTPVTDIMKAMMMGKEMSGSTSGGGGIDVLLKGIELGKELSGNAPEEGPMMTALKTLAPVLQQGIAAQAAAAARHRPAPPKPLPPKAQPGPTPVPEPAPAAESEADQMAEFMLLAKMLKRAAQKDSDPALYADLLLDQIGEDVIASAFGDDMQYTAFIGFIPGGLTPEEKAWLDEVRECLLTLPDDDDGLTHAEAISDDAGRDGSADPT